MTQDISKTTDAFVLHFDREIGKALGPRGQNIVGQFNGYTYLVTGNFDLPKVEIERLGSYGFRASTPNGEIMAESAEALVGMAAGPISASRERKFKLEGLEGLNA